MSICRPLFLTAVFTPCQAGSIPIRHRQDWEEVAVINVIPQNVIQGCCAPTHHLTPPTVCARSDWPNSFMLASSWNSFQVIDIYFCFKHPPTSRWSVEQNQTTSSCIPVPQASGFQNWETQPASTPCCQLLHLRVHDVPAAAALQPPVLRLLGPEGRPRGAPAPGVHPAPRQAGLAAALQARDCDGKGLA